MHGNTRQFSITLPAALVLAAGLASVSTALGQAGTRTLTQQFTFSVQDRHMFRDHIPEAPRSHSGRAWLLGGEFDGIDIDLYDNASNPAPGIAGAFASMSVAPGALGVEARFTVNGGSVSATAPYDLRLTVPETFVPGQRVVVKTEAALREGFGFTTRGAGLSAGIDFVADINIRAGFGVQVLGDLGAPVFNTGVPEASVPSPAPPAMLERHRRDFAVFPTRGAIRSQIVSIGSGTTGLNFGTSVLPGLSVTANVPSILNVGARDNRISTEPMPEGGDRYIASASVVDTVPLASFNTNITEMITLATGGELPLDFSLSHDRSQSGFSAALVRGQIRTGAFYRQDFELHTGVGPLARFMAGGQQIGEGFLGDDIELRMPEGLDEVAVSVEITVPSIGFVNRTGIQLGSRFQLDFLTADARAIGTNLFQLGPLATAGITVPVGDPIYWFNQPLILALNERDWGVATESFTVRRVPTPGAAVLALMGGMVLCRRRRAA